MGADIPRPPYTVNEMRERHGLPSFPEPATAELEEFYISCMPPPEPMECELCSRLHTEKPVKLYGEEFHLCAVCKRDVSTINNPELPKPPKPPPVRVVREGDVGGKCPECHSSVTRKYWFVGYARCVSCSWHGEGKELWGGYKAGGAVGNREDLLQAWSGYGSGKTAILSSGLQYAQIHDNSIAEMCQSVEWPHGTPANPDAVVRTTGQLRRSYLGKPFKVSKE